MRSFFSPDLSEKILPGSSISKFADVLGLQNGQRPDYKVALVTQVSRLHMPLLDATFGLDLLMLRYSLARLKY